MRARKRGGGRGEERGRGGGAPCAGAQSRSASSLLFSLAPNDLTGRFKQRFNKQDCVKRARRDYRKICGAAASLLLCPVEQKSPRPCPCLFCVCDLLSTPTTHTACVRGRAATSIAAAACPTHTALVCSEFRLRQLLKPPAPSLSFTPHSLRAHALGLLDLDVHALAQQRHLAVPAAVFGRDGVGVGVRGRCVRMCVWQNRQ